MQYVSLNVMMPAGNTDRPVNARQFGRMQTVGRSCHFDTVYKSRHAIDPAQTNLLLQKSVVADIVGLPLISNLC